LKVLGPILFSYFVLMVVAHGAVLTNPARPVMMISAGVTALVVAVMGVSAHRGATWALSHATRWLTLAGLLAALNACLHLTMIPEPVQTTNLMLAVVAASLFLTSRLGLGLVFACVGLTFLGVASSHPSPDWVHFGFALTTTYALGLPLFIARARKQTSLTQASLDEQQARKSLESAVTETQMSELRYRTLVDRCPDAVFVIRGGVIQYVNPAAEILLDIREGTVVGTPVTDLRPSTTTYNLGDDCDRLEIVDASGQTISVATSSTHVQFDGSTVEVVFARDMSEQLASEKLQSDFLAAVSHELRTPLTSIVGALGLLGGSGGDERDRTLLAVASRNAGKLGKLIEELLDLRDLETEETPSEDQLGDITLVSVVKIAVASFADPRGRIQIHANEDIWVHGDRRALARVVHHLIDNAVRFGGPGHDIDIRISTVADDACIHVNDRGPGVPRRYRETMFRGFSQGKAGLARPHGGFGVGLTLSRGIVQQHKGRMTLHDRDGGGAAVTICLPRIEPPAG
jgi:signal transduction histidine kinase